MTVCGGTACTVPCRTSTGVFQECHKVRWAITAADLGHEAKVQYANLAFWGANEVARVGVSMQEACLQQLNEVAVEQRGAQLPHIACCALTQLFTYTPIIADALLRSCQS